MKGFNSIPGIVEQLRADSSLRVEAGVLISEVAEYAIKNEYGGESEGIPVPERSFMRSTADDKATHMELGKLVARAYYKTFDRKAALAAIGARLAFLIKKKIDTRVPPPNAWITIWKKKHDHTLIGITRRMRDKMAWRLI
jgi:hypothetical protein